VVRGGSLGQQRLVGHLFSGGRNDATRFGQQLIDMFDEPRLHLGVGPQRIVGALANDVQCVRGATLAPFSAVLVDFGQYDFNDRQFTDPLGCYVASWPLNWGGFMDRNSRYYVQPDSQIAVDGMLGRMVATPRWVLDWTGATGPAETNGLFLFSAELARDVKRGALSRSAFERRISSFVRSATSKLDRRQSIIASERDSHAASRSTTIDAAVPGSVSDALDHVEGYLAQNTLRRLYRGARRPDGTHRAADLVPDALDKASL
jgi:hypothetical protein